jgi:hypothetical protein
MVSDIGFPFARVRDCLWRQDKHCDFASTGFDDFRKRQGHDLRFLFGKADEALPEGFDGVSVQADLRRDHGRPARPQYPRPVPACSLPLIHRQAMQREAMQ